MSENSILEIEAQFPELAPVSASYLGEGCDSAALLVNDTWVFRFPKRREVEAQLEIEVALLPRIAPLLPLPIPDFRFFGRPGAHCERRFVGYARIPGIPALTLDASDLADGQAALLGQCLASLHAIPLAHARDAGVPLEDLEATLDEVRAEALESLAEVERVAPDAPHAEWRRFILDPPVVRTVASGVLVHNDLAAEHVLVDPASGRVTGVIDWTDAAISRPEVDIAGFYHWGGAALVDRVLAGYGLGRLDAAALARARYLGACRGAMDVAFAIAMQRPEYIAAGLRALRFCASL